MKQKCRVSLAVLLAALAGVLGGAAAWARNAPTFSLPDADGKENGKRNTALLSHGNLEDVPASESISSAAGRRSRTSSR